MNLTVTPQELLYLYDCLIRDNSKKEFFSSETDSNILLHRVRTEILGCLEKFHDETTSKQYKIWNEKESKKIESLEKINNDVKLTSDMVKKFSEASEAS